MRPTDEQLITTLRYKLYFEPQQFAVCLLWIHVQQTVAAVSDIRNYLQAWGPGLQAFS